MTEHETCSLLMLEVHCNFCMSLLSEHVNHQHSDSNYTCWPQVLSHRVLLTIEEKHLPYGLSLVDLANKLDWYLLTFLNHIVNCSST
jgi:hypothetical protein